MRLGQDVGHKVGAGGGRHDDHLDKFEIFYYLMLQDKRQVSDGALMYLAIHLLRGGIGGLDSRFGEGDLDGGQVRRQRVSDALHDVAHLGAAAHWHRDVLGHLWRHFGDLLQHHGRRA